MKTWTYEVDKTKHILKNNEFITEEGEIVKLHDKTLENMAMNIVNYKEEEEIKKQNIKQFYFDKKQFESKLVDLYGNFYFNFYSKLPNIPKQYLFRFIYLCTYIRYNDNKLYKCNNNKYSLLGENDLEYILKLSKTECFRTKKALIENNLIHISKDNTIIINNTISRQGTIKSNKSNVNYIRIFKDAIINIYNNSLPREHKNLSILILLLPYVNYNLNVLCFNTEESNAELIQPLSIIDIQKLIYNKTNSKKYELNKQLLSMKVNDEFCFLKMVKSNKEFYVINPRIYYKGNNDNEIDFLYNYFKV